ncbi:MAG: ATP-binding protein [Rickettsiales bacterium]|jgi:signal transduction histidine kinase|nr:ATP-binding protein [Rickettsiales bacterium]
MSKTEIFKIRPAGRHILTIGRDLIKDDYAAIVELVKNAYDADAKKVKIDINKINAKRIEISVEDDGHGMTYDSITNKWLVLSTDDKHKRKVSPNGRIMQGKKGIGRYAASVLGNELLLDTTDENRNNTKILLDWEKFEKAAFIDDVDILVETKQVKTPSYTKISVAGGKEYADFWNMDKISNLQLELRKLISPLHTNKEDFEITLAYQGIDLLSKEKQVVNIEPINILEYFDYRIFGNVKGGAVSLTYQNQKKGANETKSISLLEQRKGSPVLNVGEVTFDIRVYDRDKDSIEYLMGRVPEKERANFSSVIQAKSFLDKFIGVGVYRNGFRIRPLGDPGYDWLKLDERRVQNPTMRVGLNQVIGFISIENEDKSNLLEKSARDGLKENEAYNMLVELSHNVIWELEDRRYKFRHMSSERKNTQDSIDALSDAENLKKAVRKVLKDENELQQVEQIINKDQEEKQKVIDELVQKMAVYQGQATLGKIMNVVLHEGRKPLNYFSNQASNITEYITLLKKNTKDNTLNEVIRIMNEIKDNSKQLAELFKRLDPLAAGRRGRKKLENVESMIDNSFKIYSKILTDNKITVSVACDKSIKLECWLSDMSVILTNLIDNSVYWLKNDTKNNNKMICVIVSETDYAIVLDFKDNGQGITEENIGSGIIFDPGYSTKPDGTGLGLALAGEASERNNGQLMALHSKNGAHFKLTFNKRAQ